MKRAHFSRPRIARLVVIAAGLALAAAATGVGAAVSMAGPPSPARVVETTNGSVRGVVNDSYRVFNGIPYAQAPVGQLRWQAPQPASAWSGVRDGTQPGSDCVQTAVAWRPAAASTDEDCLDLNVWTPTQAHDGSGLPVAVWFHGGGSVNAAGRDFLPTSMVRQGHMLVVTVNYRLGALGFLTLPQLDSVSGSSGNYGLLDQTQSLRWVNDNIARFGGDPSRVMIAGQSAGASSVCALLASPKAAGLFSTAVVESGGTCSASPRAAAQQQDAAFVTALGCDAGDAAAVVACLRQKPPAEILNAQQHAGTWGRVIEAGVLPLDPRDAFASGAFNHVPVLTGGTANEDRAFTYEQNDLINQPITAAGYVAMVQASYGADAAAVLAHYPLANYAVPGAAWSAVRTDSRHPCPELSIAASLSTAVSTYVFEFRDETAPLRPYELVPSSFSLATQHSAELPYLWGSNTMTPLTSQQRQLSGDMIAYWAQFARTGTLDPRGLPSVPRYSSSTPHEVAFNSDGPALVDDMATKHQCSFWAGQS